MDNTITHVRGDTRVLRIDVFDENGDAYNPAQLDEITMTVRKGSHRGEIVIQKQSGNEDVVIISGGWQITIQPEDTEGLPYTAYYYDVEVTLEDGYRQTIVTCSPFNITREVTYEEPVPEVDP